MNDPSFLLTFSMRVAVKLKEKLVLKNVTYFLKRKGLNFKLPLFLKIYFLQFIREGAFIFALAVN
jgi:hypothetical protein